MPPGFSSPLFLQQFFTPCADFAHFSQWHIVGVMPVMPVTVFSYYYARHLIS